MNTQQTPTLPLALCAVCGQPTAQWVVAQNAAVIQDLNDELMARGRRIRFLEADNNTLTIENERMNRELMHPETNGDKDGYWGFIILLLAIVVSFALGWVMSSAVGV